MLKEKLARNSSSQYIMPKKLNTLVNFFISAINTTINFAIPSTNVSLKSIPRLDKKCKNI